MRETLTHNFGLKIASLALAFLVWLVVLSIEDPVYTREFTDISVIEINGDQITEAGKAYTYVGGRTVSVRVRGKTSVVDRLTKDDFRAVADLSTMSITGAVIADVTCPRYASSVEIMPIGSSTALKIEIENLVEKSLNVRVVTNGSTANGYYSAQGVATPNMITVSGPESEVNKINEAIVNVNISSANITDVTTNTELELLDVNKNNISSSTLSISQSNIDVTIPIYKTKTVPVNFNIIGEVAEGYKMVSAAYEPKEITVAGRDEALEKISAVTLHDYDIAGADKKIEDSLAVADNLADELPAGVVFTDKEATVAIVVDVQKVVEKSFELPISKIAFKGSNTAYLYVKHGLNDTDKNVSLKVKGIAEEVNNLDENSLTALVDVSGYGPGEYDLPLKVVFDGNLDMSEAVTVHVVITYRENE